jgi:hypothetical protein
MSARSISLCIAPGITIIAYRLVIENVNYVASCEAVSLVSYRNQWHTPCKYRFAL